MRLKLEARCKGFDGIEVLHHVDFNDDITTLAVIGPSGGGKSTLLRIIAGLAAPSSGRVELDGHQVAYDERTLPAYRAQLGFVFQQGGLFHHLSACDNIALPLRVVHGIPAPKAQLCALQLLDRFGLTSESNKKPAQLSGGQCQRVAIARAIAAKPRLLLLDEPTSALDPEYTAEVLDTIRDLKNEGIHFIIVTHEMGFARHACDKAVFLSDGRLLEYNTSEALFNAPKTVESQRFLSKLLEWNL
jgi:polar amino acid transport system ATP-binding protein